MAYQVLARKYRPKSFKQMMGQTPILRALTNALDNQRLHHAYLFSGTRGVGKTSIARLLAKCLNCEEKITSTPCEACGACREINNDTFLDLHEVDAATQTRIEDTRKGILDDVQYAPTRGRYKIYLIDEVHMLSTHSFNALLKTLEEPPPHVIFLLATTEPQRLPATVLSRCLHFHLKTLSVEQITQHLEYVLAQEQIPFEKSALPLLAKAANGSLRDVLSLLDQAIAYGNQSILTTDVEYLLGVIGESYISDLITAINQQQFKTLLTLSQQLAEKAVDYSALLEELASSFYRLSAYQLHGELGIEKDTLLSHLAEQIPANQLQLFYQIAITSRRDLPLAPTPRIGFEMALLRMIAFNYVESPSSIHIPSSSLAPSAEKKVNVITPEVNAVVLTPSSITPPLDIKWPELLTQLKLTGMTKALAVHCELKAQENNQWIFSLDSAQIALYSAKQESRLAEALTHHFAHPISVRIVPDASTLQTPASLENQNKQKILEEAKKNLDNDPNLQALLTTFDAKLDVNLIRILVPAEQIDNSSA